MTTTRSRAARPIILFIVCFFAVWSVRATGLYAIDESIASAGLRTVYSVVIKLLLWVLPACAFALWIRREPPLRYLGMSVLPSARQWAWSVAVVGALLGAIGAFETLAGRKSLVLSNLFQFASVPGLLAAFVSPLLEEVLFRGLLLKELSALLPRWRANLVTSLLFAGIHLPFWLSHGGVNLTMLANTAGVLVFSVVAGWLYLRTASVWPPWVAHVANNLMAAMLVAGRR